MHEVATILEIISSFCSTLALREILARVTEKTAQVVGADSCAISLWDRISDTVIVLADYISPEVVIPHDAINDIGLMELYLDHGRPVRFTADKVALCQALANQAVIPIENAWLFAELEAQRETLRHHLDEANRLSGGGLLLLRKSRLS